MKIVPVFKTANFYSLKRSFCGSRNETLTSEKRKRLNKSREGCTLTEMFPVSNSHLVDTEEKKRSNRTCKTNCLFRRNKVLIESKINNFALTCYISYQQMTVTFLFRFFYDERIFTLIG